MSHYKNSRHKISVVIPTLGGDMLSDTISILNKGTIRPDEILICIPNQFQNRVPNNLPDNVRLVLTSIMGQVSQRIAGFKEARNNLVFQMDDDVHVHSMALQILADGINDLGKYSSISPVLVNRLGEDSVYMKSRATSWPLKIYYFFISGLTQPMPGAILGCGIGLGWSPLKDDPPFKAMEWLPGGCVMHNKNNLVTKEFYPFEGKAYCEDLIHSRILSVKGVKLYVAKDASASIILESPFDMGVRDFLLYLRKDYMARSYFLTLENLPKYRMVIFYILQSFIYIIKKFKTSFS